MSITQTDLDSFHDFATQFLAQSKRELSFEQLVNVWQTERDQSATIEAIRRGVDDAAAGRMSDLAEVDARIRESLNFPQRGQ